MRQCRQLLLHAGEAAGWDGVGRGGLREGAGGQAGKLWAGGRGGLGVRLRGEEWPEWLWVGVLQGVGAVGQRGRPGVLWGRAQGEGGGQGGRLQTGRQQGFLGKQGAGRGGQCVLGRAGVEAHEPTD